MKLNYYEIDTDDNLTNLKISSEIEVEKIIGLDPEQIAKTVAYAIDIAKDTDVNEIIIRPIGQGV